LGCPGGCSGLLRCRAGSLSRAALLHRGRLNELVVANSAPGWCSASSARSLGTEIISLLRCCTGDGVPMHVGASMVERRATTSDPFLFVARVQSFILDARPQTPKSGKRKEKPPPKHPPPPPTPQETPEGEARVKWRLQQTALFSVRRGHRFPIPHSGRQAASIGRPGRIFYDPRRAVA